MPSGKLREVAGIKLVSNVIEGNRLSCLEHVMRKL